MYDRPTLADHFNGKRAADDPEVQRQFRLLKQQAQLDWSETYSCKDARVTAQSIEEDYIYNAKAYAKTQRDLGKIRKIAILTILAAIALIYLLKR